MAGRVAVVTGGTRGIGAAISTALKKAGYKVAANYGGNDEAAQQVQGRDRHPGLQVRRRRLQAPARQAIEEDRGGSRAGRRAGQQCRHHARRHDAPHDVRAVERGDPDQPRLVLQHVPLRHRRHARAQLRPHRQYRLDQRPGRPVRPGQLRRRQVGHPRLHQGAGAGRARPRASPSTRSRPAISTPRWCARCRRTCSRRSSRASRSAASARPTRSRAACCSWSPTTAGFITGSTLSINGGQHMY